MAEAEAAEVEAAEEAETEARRNVLERVLKSMPRLQLLLGDTLPSSTDPDPNPNLDPKQAWLLFNTFVSLPTGVCDRGYRLDAPASTSHRTMNQTDSSYHPSPPPSSVTFVRNL